MKNIDTRYHAHGINFAIDELKEIAKERILLKGHFTLVAKRCGVKVKDLIKEYKKN